MKIEVTQDDVAIPCFGQNASTRYGALLVTSRAGSDPAQVAVLSSPPTGDIRSDMSIGSPQNVDELALLSTVLVAESGFIFDGVDLCDIAYVAVSTAGNTVIDVSFVPNRVPVDLGKPGGRL